MQATTVEKERRKRDRMRTSLSHAIGKVTVTVADEGATTIATAVTVSSLGYAVTVWNIMLIDAPLSVWSVLAPAVIARLPIGSITLTPESHFDTNSPRE